MSNQLQQSQFDSRSCRSGARGAIRIPPWLAGGMLIPVAVLGCLAIAQEATPQKPTAAQAFKNIKVLKSMPADELLTTMRVYNASLGVKCDFCHVVGPNHSGFEKDTKPEKNIARQMITLTEDLNKHQKAVGGQATCYMCHHGHPMPETRAPQFEPPPGGGGR